jgi:hypothetical protein
MSHTRRPTFNISNRRTLASRGKSSPNLPLSHLERPSELPLLLTDSRLGPDDFQSNGLGELNLNIPGFVPSALGLGISYDLYTSEKIPFNTADVVEETRLVTSCHSRPVSPSGSVYDHLDYHPEPLLDELYGLFESQLPKSCSLSSVYSTLPSPSLSQQSLTLQYPGLEPWSLESVSAADQIAKLALQQITSNSHSSLSSLSDLPSSDDHFINHSAKKSCMDAYPWPVLPNYATGIRSVPNIHGTRPCLDSWEEPSFAVNPTEIMADISQDPDVDYSYILFSPDPEALYLPHSCASDHSLPDEVPADEQHSPNFNGDIYVDPDNAIATSEIGAYYHVYPIRKRKQKATSVYESSSPESSPFPSPPQRQRARKSRKPVRILPIMNIGETDMPLVKTEPLAEDDLEGAADGINLGTPVFDAHRGIDIDDLKSKAARFCVRNPGREYHNTWLVSFAGKLSKEGKLLDDFRCYVLGCDQVNKRRDHILIHVGAHLDQRPFQCRYWYVSQALRQCPY